MAVIFEMDAREQIMKLAAFMPVWAIDSTANAKAIDDARQQHQFPLTIFFCASWRIENGYVLPGFVRR